MRTIKSSAEISKLFSTGSRLKCSYLTLIFEKHAPEHNLTDGKQHDHAGRVAFIAGKRLGNAVWRNSAKRRLRSLCRDLGGPWDGYDVIFLAKSSLTEDSYSKVLKACSKALEQSAFACRTVPDEGD